MTPRAKNLIAEVLLRAQERLIGKVGPFKVLERIINDYFREWDWVD